MKRCYVNYFNVAANTSVQDFAFSIPQDDFKIRHVWGFRVNASTAHVQVNLAVENKVLVGTDLQMFAGGNPFLPVEFDVPATLQLHVQVQDFTGAGNAALGVTVLYEVDS